MGDATGGDGCGLVDHYGLVETAAGGATIVERGARVVKPIT